MLTWKEELNVLLDRHPDGAERLLAALAANAVGGSHENCIYAWVLDVPRYYDLRSACARLRLCYDEGLRVVREANLIVVDRSTRRVPWDLTELELLSCQFAGKGDLHFPNVTPEMVAVAVREWQQRRDDAADEALYDAETRRVL